MVAPASRARLRLLALTAALRPPAAGAHAGLHLLAVALLLIGALSLPLPMYLASLAVFGLPHIIWEMGFLRSRYAGRWSGAWWLALWGVLLAQAAARGAVWLGAYSPAASQIVDLLSLLLLGLIVAAAPAGTGWRARLAGLLGAAGVWLLLERGEILSALLVLALLHNFTPLAMAWDMARGDRGDPRARMLAWAVTGLFALPLLVAFSGWTGIAMPDAAAAMTAGQSSLLDAQWPQAWSVERRPAILSAIVLAQCLHYYCVIVLLPGAEHARTGKPVLSRRGGRLAWAAAAMALAYYLVDYTGARHFYAVAAGAHAWLEWPVLLMAWLGANRGTR